MLVFKSVFNMLMRNVSPRGHTSFRCLMFSLSGPCELLFLHCFSCGGVMLYPCILCVALLMDLFILCVVCMTVFVNCWVIFSFKNVSAGSQVFALLLLFICVILHIMWSVKSLQLLCILPFGMLCLSAISMMFVKMLLAVCMLVGLSGLCVIRKLCPVGFLVVSESPSILL